MPEREQYQPTADQAALAVAIADALQGLLPIARLHARDHEHEDAWRALMELGVFSVSQDESRGGAGLGVVEEVLVAFELGRRLAAPAVLATLAAAPHAGPAPFEAVAAGWIEAGRGVLVDEPQAGQVLVRDGDQAWLLPRPMTAPVLDQTHWCARLLDIDPPAQAPLSLDAFARARLILIDAAALAGLATTAQDMAVDYAGFRQQFGRPIGSFQAVKHHCANMALAARGARDLSGFAAVALAAGDEDGPAMAAAALVVAAKAAIDNAGLNVQIHGGVGFSEEADPHLLVKRARIYLGMAGGLDAAIERVAAGAEAAL